MLSDFFSDLTLSLPVLRSLHISSESMVSERDDDSLIAFDRIVVVRNMPEAEFLQKLDNTEAR